LKCYSYRGCKWLFRESALNLGDAYFDYIQAMLLQECFPVLSSCIIADLVIEELCRDMRDETRPPVCER